MRGARAPHCSRPQNGGAAEPTVMRGLPFPFPVTRADGIPPAPLLSWPHQHEGVEHPGDVVGIQTVGVVPWLPAASSVTPAGGSGAWGALAEGHRGEGVL